MIQYESSISCASKKFSGSPKLRAIARMTIPPHRSIEAMYVSRRSANPGGEAGHCGLSAQSPC
jgi:hypothetical protein